MASLQKKFSTESKAEQGKVYEQLCNSYRAIDDFRAKLLGFLPLATGTGVFLLVSTLVTEQAKIDSIKPLFLPIGIFGFAITLGLFLYELYGIKKCGALIEAGKGLETKLNVKGQFRKRPPGVLLIINEPLAAGVIYPAVLAAWTFLAFAFPLHQGAAQGQPQGTTTLINPDAAEWWAISVFLLFFAVSFFYNLFLIKNDIKVALNKTWLGHPWKTWLRHPWETWRRRTAMTNEKQRDGNSVTKRGAA